MSLKGKRIVVTRAVHQAESLMNLLREKQAIPLLYPCISIVTRDFEIDTNAYDWLVITSSNTAFALKGQQFNGMKIAAVGESTAQAIKDYLGEEADFVAEVQSAQSLGETLPISSGEHVLLPQSNLAREMLSEILSQRGAIVHSIHAYDNLPGEGGDDIPAMLDSIDALTFTSGSTVENFITRIQPRTAFHLPAAVIGDSTATVAQVHGFKTIVPETYSIDAMIAALELYFS